MKTTLLLTVMLFIGICSFGQSGYHSTSSGPDVLPSGHYGTVLLNPSGTLIIDSPVTIDNINGYTNSSIMVKDGGILTVGNLHLNGNSIFINKAGGIVHVTGSVELQNGDNRLYNEGELNAKEFQINDNTSYMELTGCNSILTVAGSLNLNTNKSGSVSMKLRARIYTSGLNIGGSNLFIGNGFIKVTGNLNLNHPLTKSREITFCYSGYLNQPEKVRPAIISCDYAFCSPLPVTLSSFNAVKEGNIATLIWETTEETNSSHFEIQHSSNGVDWNIEDKVQSNNNGKAEHNYTYTFGKKLYGSNYFRLNMVDFDGTSAKSTIRSLTFDSMVKESLKFGPNPTTDYLTIDVYDWSLVKSVHLINMNGMIVSSGNSNTINVKYLQSGTYILNLIYKTGEVSRNKIVITK